VRQVEQGKIMKKLLVGVLGVVSMATSASAADLAARPYTKAPPVVSPAYNWSGFYIGGNVGYSFGRVDEQSSSTLVAGPFAPGVILPPAIANTLVTVPFASSTRTPVDGVIGGGQIGYNAQFNRWVLGIEADIQASDQKRNTSTFTSFGGSTGPIPGFLAVNTFVTGTQTETVNTRLDWFGTVRGRVGYTSGDLMWYGTGGLAYGQFKTSVTQSSVVTVQSTFFPSPGNFTSAGALNASQNRTGWTAGGGVEGALWATGWTWKFEYLHLDFDRVNYVFTTVAAGSVSPSVVTRSARFTDDIIRVGLNYRFNWGGAGVVASY
jgi:outer membrane immunogenic protein